VFQRPVSVEDDGVPKVSTASHTPEPIEEKPCPGYEGPARGAPRYGGFDWN
jgi:hypothetical protein